jgi:hypothetical protein
LRKPTYTTEIPHFPIKPIFQSSTLTKLAYILPKKSNWGTHSTVNIFITCYQCEPFYSNIIGKDSKEELNESV